MCERTELFELSNVNCLGDCGMRGLKILNVDDSKEKYVRGLKRKLNYWV